MKPTTEQFTAMELLYEYFNVKLFDNKLARCMINFSRKNNTHGFFAPERWSHYNQGDHALKKQDKRMHEISLNPETLSRKPINVCGTLVHEMCHLWQHDHGKPSRGGYHNKEWATKMKEVGLYPSSNGMKGGKETGQHMTHYIIPEDNYEKNFKRLNKKALYPLTCIAEIKNKSKSKNKTKYCCPTCETNAWGKDEIHLICGNCKKKMLPE